MQSLTRSSKYFDIANHLAAAFCLALKSFVTRMKNMRRLKRARRARGECSMANVLSWSMKHLMKGISMKLRK